jgi:hypothetical protein
VLLECKQFAAARAVCVDELHRMNYPTEFTLSLLLGEPPPPPALSMSGERAFLRMLHDQCLSITGDFLQEVDRRIHL